MDDIVASSSTWTQHVKTPLAVASLMLNLAKCEFDKAIITYIGKHVGQGQIIPVAAKEQAIVDFPLIKRARSCVNSWVRWVITGHSVKNFSNVITLLTSFTNTKAPLLWFNKCQTAFEAAKDLLCRAPVLAAQAPS